MMVSLFYILIIAGILSILLIIKAMNHYLLKILTDAPEIERRLLEGEYTSFQAARAQYALDYFESRGLYNTGLLDSKSHGGDKS